MLSIKQELVILEAFMMGNSSSHVSLYQLSTPVGESGSCFESFTYFYRNATAEWELFLEKYVEDERERDLLLPFATIIFSERAKFRNSRVQRVVVVKSLKCILHDKFSRRFALGIVILLKFLCDTLMNPKT